MFSRADAQVLREALGPFSPLSQEDGEQAQPAILQQYRNYYGLNLGGSKLPVTHHAGTLVSGASTLVAQYFAVPMDRQVGTAVILHGYFDHTGLYGHLIKNCLEQGLSVVSLDLPGHGLSTGTPASISSFTLYGDALIALLKRVEEQGVAQPWFAIGQSTGAAIFMDSVLNECLAEEFAVRSFILLAPLLKPYGWNKARILFHSTRLFLSSTPRRFSVNSHDQEFLDFLRGQDALQSKRLPRDWVLAMLDYQERFARAQVSNVPMHIIQGTDDKTVDWQNNIEKIAEKFPRSLSYLVAGARHHLVNESAEYRNKVFGQVSQIIADGLE